MDQLNWLTEKPTLNFECVLITAQWMKWHKPYHWEYSLWEITWDEEGQCWLLCEPDGEVWGDIADLRADKYAIIQPLEKR